LNTWSFQDLPFKAKYLVTFTVGFEQREIINAAISKVSRTSYIMFHSFWAQYIYHHSLSVLVCCSSSQKTGQLSSSTTMAVKVNGNNMSGLKKSYILVRESNQSGWHIILYLLIIEQYTTILYHLCADFDVLKIFRWFAKRFLHPDVVAPYEYIFVWDEDLGLDNFDADL
jgi:hypothetical protein